MKAYLCWLSELVFILFVFGIAQAQTDGKSSMPVTVEKIEIQRGLSDREKECIECHAKNEPGKINVWLNSLHARANITCLDCHGRQKTDKDAGECPGTKKYKDIFISPLVSPKVCARCHPREEMQFSTSKHSGTWAIQTVEIKDPWLKGMNSEIERATGCLMCHGSDISSGKFTVENWPNQGCGRKNPDGSYGSCVICHTTHHFSIEEARKPETCGQCHLGPDHPQDEIYFGSRHGKRYLADGANWNFTSAPDGWEPSSDFSAPTCAVCHISGIGPLSTTHDLGERLKWESQLPLSILNKDHNGNEARKKMLTVCTQCHSPRWSGNYLLRYDKVIMEYNDIYFKPIKSVMDNLYTKKILTKWPVFDEEIEWAFYEYWHHEGRRARMGSAMMGPDYSWWHGFYDLKKSYQKIIKLADEAVKNGNGSPVFVPGGSEKNLTNDKVIPLPKAWGEIKNLKGKP